MNIPRTRRYPMRAAVGWPPPPTCPSWCTCRQHPAKSAYWFCNPTPGLALRCVKNPTEPREEPA